MLHEIAYVHHMTGEQTERQEMWLRICNLFCKNYSMMCIHCRQRQRTRILAMFTGCSAFTRNNTVTHMSICMAEVRVTRSCMYVCICIHTPHIYMYTHTHIISFLHVHICTFACIKTHTYIHVQICIVHIHS